MGNIKWDVDIRPAAFLALFLEFLNDGGERDQCWLTVEN